LYSLKKRDLPAYRQTCADMVRRFTTSKNAVDRYFTAWTCALGPEGVAADPTVVELARRSASLLPETRFRFPPIGPVLYRSGQLDEALTQLTMAVNAPKNLGAPETYSHFFLAMTHHRLGHRDEARHWFDQAAQATKKMLAHSDAGEPVAWIRRLTLELLHAEAKALLGITEKTEAMGKH
jgi:hypothetical protein